MSKSATVSVREKNIREGTFLLCAHKWGLRSQHCDECALDPLSPGAMGLNIVSSDKGFFSAVSWSLGVPLQNPRRCPAISLEHFQILNPWCPKRQNPSKNDVSTDIYWVKTTLGPCLTSSSGNLCVKTWHWLIQTASITVNLAARWRMKIKNIAFSFPEIKNTWCPPQWERGPNKLKCHEDLVAIICTLQNMQMYMFFTLIKVKCEFLWSE